MIRKIERTWFEIWGTEEAQNRMLKGLLAFMVFLVAALSFALVIVAVRHPVVIAVSSEATKVLAPSVPESEVLQNEARRVITRYLDLSHTWEWQSIDNSMAAAAKLVGKDYAKKFIQSNADQVKLAKNKHLSQRFHISNIELDDKAHVARVSGDRVLVIDSLRAVNPMTFEIGYEIENRTVENPEGVYIISETNLTK